MYWDDIGNLLAYASKRYSSPNIHWKKRRFQLRCYEILAYENAMNSCMDNPFTDPNDILEDYLIYLEWCVGYFEKDVKRKEEYIKMKYVILTLLNHL